MYCQTYTEIPVAHTDKIEIICHDPCSYKELNPQIKLVIQIQKYFQLTDQDFFPKGSRGAAVLRCQCVMLVGAGVLPWHRGWFPSPYATWEMSRSFHC